MLFKKNLHEVSFTELALVELLQAVFDKEKCFKFRTIGLSVFPFVKNNDVVTVCPLQGTLPNLGDIVVFIHPRTKKLVVQRLIGENKDSYLIKENSVKVKYSSIPKLKILGRVEKVERNGKEVFI